ncbi:MAG: FkbM family methyltransferase [Myxococcales bacterium]|nr:FkbM family methyltransferase [Myxococcales bacterium]
MRTGSFWLLTALLLASACSNDEAAETTTTTRAEVDANGEGEGAKADGSEPAPGPDALAALSAVEVDPDEVLIVQGSKMALNPDDLVVSKVIKRDGIWEPLESNLFFSELKPGEVVVDAGANIGYYTLLAARLVGPTGHVYAFEPEPEAVALLRRNVALNGYDNVTVVPKALGREAGTLQLFLAKKNRGDHRIYDPSGKREAIDVEVVALDDYLETQGVTHVDLMKIDTQGAECTILAGAQRLIANHPELAIIMEYTPHSLVAMGEEPKDCLEGLAGAGYVFRDIREWEHRLTDTDVETLLRSYSREDHKQFTNLFLPARGEAAGR